VGADDQVVVQGRRRTKQRPRTLLALRRSFATQTKNLLLFVCQPHQIRRAQTRSDGATLNTAVSIYPRKGQTSFCYPGASERQTSARPSRLTVKLYSSRQPSARMAHVQSLVVVLYLAVAVIKVVKRSLRAQTANITKRRQNSNAHPINSREADDIVTRHPMRGCLFMSMFVSVRVRHTCSWLCEAGAPAGGRRQGV
jgi:hypothetical protein